MANTKSVFNEQFTEISKFEDMKRVLILHVLINSMNEDTNIELLNTGTRYVVREDKSGYIIATFGTYSYEMYEPQSDWTKSMLDNSKQVSDYLSKF